MPSCIIEQNCAFPFILLFFTLFVSTVCSYLCKVKSQNLTSAVPHQTYADLVSRKPRIKSPFIQQVLNQQNLLSKYQINCGCWNKRLSFIRVCLGEMRTRSQTKWCLKERWEKPPGDDSWWSCGQSTWLRTANKATGFWVCFFFFFLGKKYAMLWKSIKKKKN